MHFQRVYKMTPAQTDVSHITPQSGYSQGFVCDLVALSAAGVLRVRKIMGQAGYDDFSIRELHGRKFLSAFNVRNSFIVVIVSDLNF